MKAIEINGEIKVYNSLPNSWKGVMGNFSKLSDEEIKAYGFYDVIQPEYDPIIEELGALYLKDNKYYYTVNAKTWSKTVAELKEEKINQLNYNTKAELEITDWYYIRKLNRNIDVPQEVEDQRTIILNNHNDHETALNALTKKTDIVKYEFR
tara:strand:- start:293 stop:748 length:456 start_codon:yes stop_codon:yes gene_type:complete